MDSRNRLSDKLEGPYTQFRLRGTEDSQMDASGGMLKVDKLDATNFYSWKEKIQLVLSLRELDD